MKTKQQVAEELVQAIVTDLTQREGGNYFFCASCGQEEQAEIRAAWTAILAPHVIGEGD